jgi:hypothetical protein
MKNQQLPDQDNGVGVKVNQDIFRFHSYHSQEDCTRLLHTKAGLPEIIFETRTAAHNFLPDHESYLHHHKSGVIILEIQERPTSFYREANEVKGKQDRDLIWETKYRKANEEQWAAFLAWRNTQGIKHWTYPGRRYFRVQKILGF